MDKSNDRILKEEIVVDPLFKELYESGADMDSFVATKDLSVRNHMEVQAICQKHIDNSISKTINIPNDYDINDYGDLMLEFGPQLKGMTVYRQGSRGNEPLSPVTVEQAIEYLENEQAIEGSAATDCPSGICELPVSVTE